jgi:serine/threonine-protein kinase
VLGSPLYMSPEQLRTPGEVDGRGDVWSLGVILFQMLTQDYPFVAETLPHLMIKVLDSEPVRLRALLPLAPEGLENVLLRALAKDREQRYPSVTDFALALAPYGTEASRVSLASIESALPAREGASSAAGPAPASSPKDSVPEDTGTSGTLAMWPGRASTLEPVDTSLASSTPEARSAGGRKVLFASLAIGLTSLVVIAAVSLTRAPTSTAPSGGASGMASAEVGPAAAQGSSSAAYGLVPAPSAGLPGQNATTQESDATSGAGAVPSGGVSSTAQANKAKPPGLTASRLASEKPKPVASVPSAAASPVPPPNCTPPYRLDGNGKHVPKPECL